MTDIATRWAAKETRSWTHGGLTNGLPIERPKFRHYRPFVDAVKTYVDEARDGERIYFGIDEFDAQIRGVGRGQLCIINGFSHSGKCVTLDTVFTSADGRRVPADRLRVGDRVQGMSGPETIVAVEDNGTHAIVRIETHCGLILRVTEEHPVLTSTGWVNAGDISAGTSLVGEPDWLNRSPEGGLTSTEARFMGHLIGDGMLKHAPTFTNNDPDVLESVKVALGELGCSLRSRDDVTRPYDYLILASGGGKRSPFQTWMVANGMSISTSHYKRVPTAVMTGDRNAALGFLAGLLDTDGGIDKGKIDWYSVSRELLEDCQALLARLGFRAKLVRKNGKYNGNLHESWRLSIAPRDGSQAIFRQLPLAGRKRFAEVNPPNVLGPRNKMPLIVKTVEVQEPEPTLAVQVTGSHTHVTNGIVTHNTLLLAHILRANRHKRIAFFTPDEPAQLVLAKLASAQSGVPADEIEDRIAGGDETAVDILRKTALHDFPNLAVFDKPLRGEDMDVAVKEAETVWGEPCQGVVVDFLELLQAGETVSQKGEFVKAFGSQRNLPVILIHQTSRTAGKDGAAQTISSGAYGGETLATFQLGVWRKKAAIAAALVEVRDKIARAVNGGTDQMLERQEDLLHELARAEYTLTVAITKNKRPGRREGREEIDFELFGATGLIAPLPEGDLPQQYRERLAASRQTHALSSIVSPDMPITSDQWGQPPLSDDDFYETEQW